jgi:uncharacterized membrane protein YidH (DUF202 family)
MNKTSTGIFLIVVGMIFIYWGIEMKRKKNEKKDRKYDVYDSARVLSNIILGIIFILGGLFNIILS